MKFLRKCLWFLMLAFLAYSYLLPAVIEQKRKEWEENGMASVLETLDSNQDQQE